MDRLIKRSVVVLSFLLWLLTGQSVHAAVPTISFAAPIGIIHADDLIPVDINVDSGGIVMNAVEATISFSPTQLRVDHIQREQTAFELWPEVPRWDNAAGTAHIIAGRPGGMVAIGARVATIYFRAQQPGAAMLNIQSAASGLYLNDGVGTKVVVQGTPAAITIHDELTTGIVLRSSTHPEEGRWYRKNTITVSWDAVADTMYSYQLSTDPQATPDTTPETTIGEVTFPDVADGRYVFTIKSKTGSGPWSDVSQRRFLIDTTPPEAPALVSPDPQVVGGKHLLVWPESDMTSGISRSEAKIGSMAIGPVSSPLTLHPGWRGKKITITVIDQAGNEAHAVWQYGTSRSVVWTLSLLGGMVVLTIIIFSGVIMRRRK